MNFTIISLFILCAHVKYVNYSIARCAFKHDICTWMGPNCALIMSRGYILFFGFGGTPYHLSRLYAIANYMTKTQAQKVPPPPLEYLLQHFMN